MILHDLIETENTPLLACSSEPRADLVTIRSGTGFHRPSSRGYECVRARWKTVPEQGRSAGCPRRVDLARDSHCQGLDVTLVGTLIHDERWLGVSHVVLTTGDGGHDGHCSEKVNAFAGRVVRFHPSEC